MRFRTTVVMLLATGALLTACGPDGTSASSKPSTPTTAGTVAAAPAATASLATAALPSLIGMGLQSAQDAAQAAGFYALISHDSTGRGRHQILDRDWKVCTQTPAAGKTVPDTTEVNLGAVKLTEICPARDQTPPAKAGATMPNFAGKAVSGSRAALASGTSITVSDASGNRMILVESNWKVCSQTPGAGTALNGQPVTFTAVKFGETCP